MPSGLFYLNSLDWSKSNRRSVWLFLILCFLETHVSKANSVDSDQTPYSAAPDLGLHCLPMCLLWDTRHKWVKMKFVIDLQDVIAKYMSQFLTMHYFTWQGSFVCVNDNSGELLHLVDFPPFLQGRQLLWLPVSFSEHDTPSDKGSTLRGKNLLPRGEN